MKESKSRENKAEQKSNTWAAKVKRHAKGKDTGKCRVSH
jgi:hypothetical protein